MVLLILAMTNSAISILMADIEGDLLGFLLSTALIVIFAEIMPQVIVNRYPILLSYYSRHIMWLFFYLLFIIAWPLGVIINRILGESEGNLLSKT
jgi:metal transporter CNNM